MVEAIRNSGGIWLNVAISSSAVRPRWFMANLVLCAKLAFFVEVLNCPSLSQRDILAGLADPSSLVQ